MATSTIAERAERVLNLAENCEMLTELGRGSFGHVQKVIYRLSGETYALKTVKFKGEGSETLALLEIYHHREMKHHNIVNVAAFDIDFEKHEMNLLLEHCAGGSLASVLEMHRVMGTRLPMHAVWSYFVQLVEGIHYMHTPAQRASTLLDGAIVHRDLKPDNILFGDEDQHKLKIADLGLSKMCEPGEKIGPESTGTFIYMAPEVILDEKYDESADMWSLGCVAYQMLFEGHPFEGQQEAQIHFAHMECSPIEMPGFARDSDLAEIIKNLLKYDPAKRLKTTEIMKMAIFREKAWVRAVMIRDRALAESQRWMWEQQVRYQLQLGVQAKIIHELERRLAEAGLQDSDLTYRLATSSSRQEGEEAKEGLPSPGVPTEDVRVISESASSSICLVDATDKCEGGSDHESTSHSTSACEGLVAQKTETGAPTSIHSCSAAVERRGIRVKFDPQGRGRGGVNYHQAAQPDFVGPWNPLSGTLPTRIDVHLLGLGKSDNDLMGDSDDGAAQYFSEVIRELGMEMESPLGGASFGSLEDS